MSAADQEPKPETPRGRPGDGADDLIPLEPAPPKPVTPGPVVGGPAGGKGARIDRPSLTTGQLSRCPNCGAGLAGDAVLCTACGLDLRIGAKREVEVGEVEPPEPGGDARPEYVKPSRMSPGTHAALAGGCALGAMIAAGVNASIYSGGRATTLLIVVVVLLTLYQTLVHTGTGIVAVAIAAKLAKHQVGRYDWAAGRMFLAFATFQFVSHQRIPGAPETLSVILAYPAAAAAYFFMVMALFKLRRDQATMLCGAHLMLWLLFVGGLELSRWMGAELAAMPPPPPPPTAGP